SLPANRNSGDRFHAVPAVLCCAAGQSTVSIFVTVKPPFSITALILSSGRAAFSTASAVPASWSAAALSTSGRASSIRLRRAEQPPQCMPSTFINFFIGSYLLVKLQNQMGTDFGSADAVYHIAYALHRFGKGLLRRAGVHTDDRRALCRAGRCFLHAGHALQRLLDRGFAVFAHHAFDLQGLFDGLLRRGRGGDRAGRGTFPCCRLRRTFMADRLILAGAAH